MKKILLIIILFLLHPLGIFASNPEFSTQQTITYTINHYGHAQVEHQVTITNNFSNIYPQKYIIEISGQKINNISATDQQGNILQNIEEKQGTTSIHLNFNNGQAGKGKQTNFQLNYHIPKLAKQNGQLWEINLPQSKQKDNTVILKVPLEFGQLAFSSVNSQKQKTANYQQFTFSPQSQQKISLAFGQSQIFDFKLKYFLDNPNSQSITSTIPIPADTNSQDVIINKIEPPPQNVNLDADGNWLAQYQLKAKQQLNIIVQGQAQTHLPNPNFDSYFPINTDALTAPQPFWPSQDSTIKQISQSLKSAKSIYNYVVDKLNYSQNIDQIQRQGALQAILNPNQALCTEFTDLFVTLARSQNIPSQEVEGYAYTDDDQVKTANPHSDVLHAWPRYWSESKKIWVSVDPTWEKTTQGVDYFINHNLNHLVFVIHGHHSQKPAPPGSYKQHPQDKSIQVDFAKHRLQPDYQRPQLSTFASKITINNPNPTAIYQIQLSSNNWQKNIPALPPFSHLEIEPPPQNFFSKLLPNSSQINIKVKVDQQPDFNFQLQQSNPIPITFIVTIILIILSTSVIIVIRKK
ncbi:hypothetical protein DRH14_00985 [Candidatus Shapirobacteria bacterium]|nr:MAG: hypothetical protein DRH14_00985 [Candidatus Shapirobacteria bacterium]